MNSIQSVNPNTINFQGKYMQKAKSVARKQAAHLFVQSSSWCILETISPSVNITDLLLKKICIDLGEYISKKLPVKGQTPFDLKHNIFNIFSY